jgi:hypothetical protein
MIYSPTEIENIKRLVETQQSDSLLLALELCHARSSASEIEWLVYWLGHCLHWEGNTLAWKTARSLLTQSTFEIYQPLTPRLFLAPEHLENQKKTLTSKQLNWLCDQIFCYFRTEVSHHYFLKRFLIKYCSNSIKLRLIESLKERDHLGRIRLDLGKLDLNHLPPIFEEANDIQILSLWGNQLEVLPDIWHCFPKLEELTLVHNHIKQLPKSMELLSNLKKLFLHDNPIETTALKELLKKLPNLSYLSLSDNAPIDRVLEYQRIEVLVNHQKLYASLPEQQTYWALLLSDKIATSKIQFPYLVKALNDKDEFVQREALTQILHWHKEPVSITKKSCIAILGLISFATRQYIHQLQQVGYIFEESVSHNTTHLLLGYDIPNLAFITEQFHFVNEDNILALK